AQVQRRSRREVLVGRPAQARPQRHAGILPSGEILRQAANDLAEIAEPFLADLFRIDRDDGGRRIVDANSASRDGDHLALGAGKASALAGPRASGPMKCTALTNDGDRARRVRAVRKSRSTK